MNKIIVICNIAVVSIVMLMASGCDSKPSTPDYEQQGQRWLTLARASLRDADYSLARVYIDSLRTRCAMALNAREDAILLLDSIDLAEAREQLGEAEYMAKQTGLDYIARDSFDTRLDRARAKVHFFEKKILYDHQHKEHH